MPIKSPSPNHVPDLPSLSPPEAGEYGEFFAPYVAALEGRDPFALLRAQGPALLDLAASLAEEGSKARYAPGKWSVREVLGHLSDVERLMSHWLFRIARADPDPLLGLEEADYVALAGFHDRTASRLAEDFNLVRAATLSFFDGLPAEALKRTGTLRGQPMSARAVVHIIPGHVEHHLEILRTRYGLSIRPTLSSPGSR